VKRYFRTPATEIPASLTLSAVAGTSAAAIKKDPILAASDDGGRGRFGVKQFGSPLYLSDAGKTSVPPGL
jgi:hypothetical protein